jgi:ABC-type dipeptide/oligopeptide/nickel transport system permease subunit
MISEANPMTFLSTTYAMKRSPDFLRRFSTLCPLEIHFFGVDREKLRKADQDRQVLPWYFLRADRYGHDLFSRIIYGARISLFISVVAIVIQRGIEIINGFPQLPLWLAFAAAMPGDWSATGHLLLDYHRA